MKKLIAFLLFLLFIGNGVYAQQIQLHKPDSILFDKTVYDYGTMVQGSKGDCVFIFTNQGKKPLLLRNVRASCGCTVAEWTKKPVEPGKTGLIKIKYNTAIVGSFNKSITVYSNAANSAVILKIKGNVVAEK